MDLPTIPWETLQTRRGSSYCVRASTASQDEQRVVVDHDLRSGAERLRSDFTEKRNVL